MARILLKIVLLYMPLLYVCSAGAENYDPLLLRAQASIYPKIILLDKSLGKKIPHNEIVITIISSAEEVLEAQQLKAYIEEKYLSGLGGNKLVVNILTDSEFSGDTVATAYIVLSCAEALYEKVVSHASGHGRIVFSYSYADFERKSLMSLYVKEKTYIYFNKSAAHLYDIKFSPVFYKVVKVIE